MVTANNYMFRPLTGHHQVVYTMKRVEGALYNVQCNYRLITKSRHQTVVTLYIVQPPPQPFSLCVQPADGLLEAETCSC